MIRMNVSAFLELQGDISDAEFARRLGISRTQLWRIRREKSAVGGDFIEKFMIAYPEMSLNKYFFTDAVPLRAQNNMDGTGDAKRTNFFAQGVPLGARNSVEGTAEGAGES